MPDRRRDYGPQGCAECGIMLSLVAALFLNLGVKVVRKGKASK